MLIEYMNEFYNNSLAVLSHCTVIQLQYFNELHIIDHRIAKGGTT